jgi:hypothetical protein
MIRQITGSLFVWRNMCACIVLMSGIFNLIGGLVMRDDINDEIVCTNRKSLHAILFTYLGLKLILAGFVRK